MAAEYLFESPEHFRTLVHNVDGYLYTVLYENGAAAASYHSPRCTEITGYTPEEYRQDSRLWIDMVHPGDRDKIFTLFDSRTTRAPQTYIEHRIIKKDGTVRWISNRFSEQFDSEGKISRRDGFIADITDRISVEHRFERTMRRLQQLENIIRKSPAIVVLRRNETGLPLRFITSNVSLLGYDAQELLRNGTLYLELIYPRDRERVKNVFHKFVAERRSDFSQEYRLLLKNGSIAWVDDHTWIRYDENGNASHFHGIIIDISLRKRALSLFRESMDRYKTLAENSNDLISEISPSAKFLYTNPGFNEALGYDAGELLNSHILRYIHPEDMAAVSDAIKKVEGQVTHRFRHKNGSWHWFESAGRQYATATGEKRAVIISRNITARKMLEQQIIRNEKLLAIGEMSAMISHEFRNSLTSIKMILQLQKESPRMYRKEKKSLDIALHSIYHMENVLKQLLNFAQPVKPEFTPTDVNVLLEESISLIRIQAQKKAVRLHRRLDAALPELNANTQSLRETFINLLFNAIQSFDTATVKIRRGILVSSERVKLRERLTDRDLNDTSEYFRAPLGGAPAQEIVLEAGTPCILIKIIDNGSGISDEHLTHIFEPFFTSKERGSGLGLAIAKRTINTHNGIMIAKSAPGKGTAMKIFLPFDPEQE